MPTPNPALVRLIDVQKLFRRHLDATEKGNVASFCDEMDAFNRALPSLPHVKADEVQMRRLIFMHTGSSESASASAAAAIAALSSLEKVR